MKFQHQYLRIFCDNGAVCPPVAECWELVGVDHTEHGDGVEHHDPTKDFQDEAEDSEGHLQNQEEKEYQLLTPDCTMT